MSTMVVEKEFEVANENHTAFMCVLYIVLGCLSIIANLTNILVFMTNRELRANYIFHIVVDFGEIVNGISYITCGIGRGTAYLNGIFATPITVHDCFYTKYWPVFLILGTEIPAWMTIVCAIERIVAVHNPANYRLYFTYRNKLILVFGALTCIGGSLTWAAISALYATRLTSTQHCAIISSTGQAFSTFHFAFVPFAYCGSFLSLCTIAYVHKKTARNMQTSGKKGPQLKAFIFMTAFDIILSSMPSIVMIGASWKLFAPNDIVVSITYSMTGLLSLCHVSMNAVFYSEFTKQVRKLTLRAMGIQVLSSTTGNRIGVTSTIMHTTGGMTQWLGFVALTHKARVRFPASEDNFFHLS
uniref:G_PROTEIN_RECEP_F1_2 domain-containing protein n=1 Tax=Panagrellus redivivus TaxID=6233 RepID=A0A7E4W0M0_PANRE